MIDSDPHALQGLKVLYVGRSIDSLPPAAAVEMLAAYVQSHGGVWVPPEGQIEKAVEQADVVISSVRDSAAGYWALCGGKRLATLEWLWDVSFRGVLTEPTGSILHFPPSRRAIEGMESAVFSLSGYKGARRIYLKHLIRLAGAHWTPELTRQNTHLLAVSWRGDKVAAARSWGIPIVTHRWLEMCIQQWAVPPLDQFGRQESQSDLERLGELPIDPDALEAWVEEAQTWARKQRGGKEERPKRRRALARSESTESGRTRRKRTGSAPAPSSTQYYVTTGTELKPAQEQALRRLGWQKEDAVGERTNVLVAERLTRTEKMLCAVARGLPIVRVEWAEQMTAQGKLLAPEAFALEDRAGEKQRGVKLADALAARRARGQGLLAGHTIYLTPRSRLEPVLRAIIEAAGGTAHRTPIDVEHIQADPKHRHMVSSGDDRRAWAAHAAAGLPVWSAELILDGVLRQRLSWRRHRLAN